MTYRIALIGAGNMGKVHASQWAAVSGAQLVAIEACTYEESQPLATQFDCAAFAYDEFDDMLRQTQPDIVDICVPTPSHRHYIERASAAGKAIFCEKPLARTMADCDAIVDAVERTGVPFMAGHVVRFFPEYARAKQLVDAGAVGKPATVRVSRMAAMPVLDSEDNWYHDPARSGGVVLDMIVHDFDWLRFAFGPVTRIYAKGLYGNPQYTGNMDYALVTLRFASGAVAHVTGSWAHPGGFRTTIEIAGDGGLIEHDSAFSAPLTVALKAAEGRIGVAVPESPTIPEENPYFLELQAFVHALENGLTPPVTVYDAYEATRIALGVLESIETGKVVTLE